jgi:hypothetical protein
MDKAGHKFLVPENEKIRKVYGLGRMKLAKY